MTDESWEDDEGCAACDAKPGEPCAWWCPVTELTGRYE